MGVFEQHESNVRSYCRVFPDIFHKAKGSIIYSERGRPFIDFFAGAGTLNYGHNHDYIKDKIISYIAEDGITHGLDMYTNAKRDFIEKFFDSILKPLNLDYKIQFCGPTGTNAVEAALKLSRKYTKRSGIFAFMGAFHGMSMGSLSVTSDIQSRMSAGVSLNNVTFFPYPSANYQNFDSIAYINEVLEDDHSGIEKPAAIIFETIQAEGGVNVAPVNWLRRLSELCKKHRILLICDDIQVGCGRAGNFFSFERAEIVPDMVILSKSISGYGLPMSILLLKPELDIWTPGEHNGTFRGNQMAFVAAKAALELRESMNLAAITREKEKFLHDYLNNKIASLNKSIQVRGIGMIWGVDVSKLGGSEAAREIVCRCFNKGLIIERAGRGDTVIKLMPPLTTEMDILEKGCSILKDSIVEFLGISGYTGG